MKRMHVLKTALSSTECAPLFEAAAAQKVRVGWLDLACGAAAPAELEAAAAVGAFRSVGVTDGCVVAVKPVPGATVLKDLLREHFAGCRLVLVRGGTEAPELLAAESGYRVRFEASVEKEFSPEALARALGKPRLWDAVSASGAQNSHR